MTNTVTLLIQTPFNVPARFYQNYVNRKMNEILSVVKERLKFNSYDRIFSWNNNVFEVRMPLSLDKDINYIMKRIIDEVNKKAVKNDFFGCNVLSTSYEFNISAITTLEQQVLHYDIQFQQ